jgi:hypothetical protein
VSVAEQVLSSGRGTSPATPRAACLLQQLAGEGIVGEYECGSMWRIVGKAARSRTQEPCQVSVPSSAADWQCAAVCGPIAAQAMYDVYDTLSMFTSEGPFYGVLLGRRPLHMAGRNLREQPRRLDKVSGLCGVGSLGLSVRCWCLQAVYGQLLFRPPPRASYGRVCARLHGFAWMGDALPLLLERLVWLRVGGKDRASVGGSPTRSAS